MRPGPVARDISQWGPGVWPDRGPHWTQPDLPVHNLWFPQQEVRHDGSQLRQSRHCWLQPGEFRFRFLGRAAESGASSVLFKPPSLSSLLRIEPPLTLSVPVSATESSVCCCPKLPAGLWAVRTAFVFLFLWLGMFQIFLPQLWPIVPVRCW